MSVHLFSGELLKRYNERIDNYSYPIIRGSCPTWDSYVGSSNKINGLLEAIEIMKDLLKSIEEGHL
jgi:hypothetical protein